MRGRALAFLAGLAIGGWHVAHADAAPPRVLAVAQETARSGWPHPPTGREINAITATVIRYEAPVVPGGGISRANCSAPVTTMARFSCGMRQGKATWSIRATMRRNGAWTIVSRTPVRRAP